MGIDKKVIDLFNPHLDEALDAWSRLLSSRRILLGEELEQYDNCTSQAKRRVRAALCPVSQDEIEGIVKIANQYKVPLYPISGGKNWGYGGANPFVDNCVIVDLRQMDKILSFDEELGIITIQPGVTQGQIAQFLKERNAPYMISTIVAGVNCSYLGNALERGFGMIPPRERFLSLTALKAVLGNGSFYQSLIADAGGHEIDKVYKWGVGPYIDGLFSQGSFGIVTEASFALARIPEQITRFYFAPKPGVAMEDLIDHLREAKQRLGNVMNSFEFGNRTKSTYQKSVNDEDAESWMVYGALHTTKRVTRAAIKDMKRILAPVFTDFVFLNHDHLERIRAFPYLYNRSKNWKYVTRNIEKMIYYKDLYRGMPDQGHLEYAFSGRSNSNMDISSDLEKQIKKAGYISFRPLMPLKGKDFVRYTALVRKISRKYRFDLKMNISIPSENHIVATTDIIFDPETQTEIAQDIHWELFIRSKAMGYIPHRMHIDLKDEYVSPDESAYCHTMTALKAALDPNDIISRGRIPLSQKHVLSI
ncbi:MAG: FAD-binding oxidoreductase [Alphaproteobacteria bacterium]|nr:FAD-binding oxidoreductase [Alphaproteobacteria bacterium]